jgi:hypothetical protein
MRWVSPRSCSIALALALASCAGPSWKQVRSEDTLFAYRRYLTAHPRSAHADEARERLATLELERDPTPVGLDRLRRDYPHSAALASLEALVAERQFDAARAAATPAAWEAFLARVPSGALAERARGNLDYLRADGFGADPAALTAFVAAHPTSDFAAEARRTLATLAAQRSGRIDAVAVRIDVAPGVPEADRLRRVFLERVRDAYAHAGIALRDTAETRLTIRHQEHAAPLRDAAGHLAKPGVLAETDVTLQRSADGPIVHEHFTERVAQDDLGSGSSAVFAPAGADYWDRFYVPIATWPTQMAHRVVWQAGGPLVGVTGDLTRAIALSPDGGFRELDLSDPAQIRVVARYQRSGLPARFDGVRQAGDRLVLFGEDGIEVVVRDRDGYRRTSGLDRGLVGDVAGIELVDGRILAAGTRGLLRIDLAKGSVERLIDRPLRGLALHGDTLLLMDDRLLYAGDAHDPQPANFATVAELARGMQLRVLRAGGSLAVALGNGGLTCWSVTRSGVRELVALRRAVVGEVADATVLGGSVFLLGDRGLQVLDPRTGRIVDALDVGSRAAVAAAGEHLVAVGGGRLEVVDAAPWVAASAPAAPAP